MELLVVVVLLGFLLAYELAATLLLLILLVKVLEFSLFDEELAYDEVISFGFETLDGILLPSLRCTEAKLLNYAIVPF